MTAKTVQDCLEEGANLFEQAELFYGHGTDNAGDEAFWLVFHYLQLPWDSPPAVLQNTVSDEDYANIQQIFTRRIEERIPAAYITGEAWFAGYPFTVNSDVLVPRSPIAELIVSGYSPWLPVSQPHILDLCTGSGCIGLASALYLPDATVVLSDISSEALAVAKENCHRHGLDERVSILESDCLDALDPNNPQHQFDLIVSNPPYVDAEDFANMPAEYHAEPELGLVSGFDGLDFIRRLLANVHQFLKPKGLLIVEVGNSWEALEAAFPQIPFTWIEFEHGGHGVFLLTREDLL